MNKLVIEVEDQIKIYNLLREKLSLNEDDADNLSNALADISKSTSKIYFDILPKLFQDLNREELVELFWNMKEEFMHIDYHIKDANLNEMIYVK
jgi:hypothetical protein